MLGEWGVKQHPHPTNFQKICCFLNAIKAKIRDPWQFFRKALTPPDKNLSYPLPWIFNTCVSMVEIYLHFFTVFCIFGSFEQRLFDYKTILQYVVMNIFFIASMQNHFSTKILFLFLLFHSMQICDELYLCNCIVLLENLFRMSDFAIFYFSVSQTPVRGPFLVRMNFKFGPGKKIVPLLGLLT